MTGKSSALQEKKFK